MTNKEKIPFFKVILGMAKADNSVDLSEMSYFQRLCATYGISGEEMEHIQTTVLMDKGAQEEALSEITSRSTKLALVYELICMAYADGTYEETEQLELDRIADILGVEQEKVKELEDLAEQKNILQKKIDAALESEATS